MTDRPAVICVGVFDGVHRGHATLLAAARDAAARRGTDPIAVVLDPPPAELLRPGFRVPRLCPVPETIRRIADLGVGSRIVAFTPEIRDLGPAEFLAALGLELAAGTVVMTPLSAFGRDRAGTPTALRHAGVAVIEVPPAQDGGSPISSSRIRAEVVAGNVESAGRLLGRDAAVWGTVVHGNGRGHDLGYPTANLAFDYLPAVPGLGIYLGTAETSERGVHPALVSVGRRPTFESAGEILVEAHLLDWSGDLYGEDLMVTVAERLRDERRFDSVEALVGQMRADEADARSRLARLPAAGMGHV